MSAVGQVRDGFTRKERAFEVMPSLRHISDPLMDVVCCDRVTLLQVQGEARAVWTNKRRAIDPFGSLVFTRFVGVCPFGPIRKEPHGFSPQKGMPYR